MGGPDTPLPYCEDHRKVIKNVEDATIHNMCKMGTITFNEIYQNAMHDSGSNRPDKK